jgi:hypothetical protein
MKSHLEREDDMILSLAAAIALSMTAQDRELLTGANVTPEISNDHCEYSEAHVLIENNYNKGATFNVSWESDTDQGTESVTVASNRSKKINADRFGSITDVSTDLGEVLDISPEGADFILPCIRKKEKSPAIKIKLDKKGKLTWQYRSK